jgi:hypothetical protein
MCVSKFVNECAREGFSKSDLPDADALAECEASLATFLAALAITPRVLSM